MPAGICCQLCRDSNRGDIISSGICNRDELCTNPRSVKGHRCTADASRKAKEPSLRNCRGTDHCRESTVIRPYAANERKLPRNTAACGCRRNGRCYIVRNIQGVDTCNPAIRICKKELVISCRGRWHSWQGGYRLASCRRQPSSNRAKTDPSGSR